LTMTENIQVRALRFMLAYLEDRGETSGRAYLFVKEALEAPRPEAQALIAYIDALFVSGNDVPTTTTLFSRSSWDIIKECLAEGLPLDYHVVEAEAVYRRKLAAYGDETRATSPLAQVRLRMNSGSTS
jgi:hypothetical protein